MSDSKTARVTPIRPSTTEETGFVIALHIGTFSIRLVFNRFGDRQAKRAEDKAAALAERQRWAEIDRLMAAQTMLDRAKGRAA